MNSCGIFCPKQMFTMNREETSHLTMGISRTMSASNPHIAILWEINRTGHSSKSFSSPRRLSYKCPQMQLRCDNVVRWTRPPEAWRHRIPTSNISGWVFSPGIVEHEWISKSIYSDRRKQLAYAMPHLATILHWKKNTLRRRMRCWWLVGPRCLPHQDARRGIWDICGYWATTALSITVGVGLRGAVS